MTNNQNQENSVNIEKEILFHPSTLFICNIISCTVCNERDKLTNGFNLINSCNRRKTLITNQFLHSL